MNLLSTTLQWHTLANLLINGQLCIRKFEICVIEVHGPGSEYVLELLWSFLCYLRDKPSQNAMFNSGLDYAFRIVHLIHRIIMAIPDGFQIPYASTSQFVSIKTVEMETARVKTTLFRNDCLRKPLLRHIHTTAPFHPNHLFISWLPSMIAFQPAIRAVAYAVLRNGLILSIHKMSRFLTYSQSDRRFNYMSILLFPI